LEWHLTAASLTSVMSQIDGEALEHKSSMRHSLAKNKTSRGSTSNSLYGKWSSTNRESRNAAEVKSRVGDWRWAGC
jgi:hypothetical protein